MQIKLYKTLSDDKECNKVLTNETVKTITIKDIKTYKTPVFYISNDVNLNLYNYCYIPDWDIYYWIVDKGRETGQRNIIYCDVDIRKTMYTDIRASSGIITRQANGESYIPDARAQKSAEVKTRILNFPTQVCTTDNKYLLTIGGVKTS